jgi:HEAT repeat protein
MRFGRCFLVCFSLLLPWQALPAQEAEVSAEELAKQLTAEDVNVRRDAAYALSAMREKSLPALDALVGALEDRDDQVYLESIRAIDALGPLALPAAPALIAKLDQWSEQRQYRTAMALSRMGEDVVPQLITALSHERPAIRRGAARACGWLGEKAATAVPKLIEQLGDSDDSVPPRVAEGLSGIGKAAEEPLRDFLKEQYPRFTADDAAQALQTQVRAAANALAGIVMLSEASRNLLFELTRSSDEELRSAALRGLATQGMQGEPWGQALVDGIDSTSELIRDAALLGVQKLDAETTAFILPKLIELLRSTDSDVRSAAGVALGGLGDRGAFGERAGALATTLVELFVETHQEAGGDSSQMHRREVVARVLTKLGPVAVPALIDAAVSDDAQRQAFLAPIGYMSPRVVDSLLEIAQSDDVSRRRCALQGMALMEPPPSNLLRPLREAMREEDAEVARTAVAGVGNFGVAAIEAVDELVELAASDGGNDGATAGEKSRGPVAREAVIALAKIAPQHPQLMPLIQQRLQGESAEDRVYAFRALAIAADDPASLLPRLIESLSDPLPEIRIAAAENLAKLGEKGSEAVAALRANLGHERGDVRRATLDALIAIGPAAAPALPELTPLLSEQDEVLLERALRLVAIIGSEAKEATSQVKPLINHPVGTIRGQAYGALVAIDLENPENVPMLMAALEDSDWSVQQTAVEKLGKQGPKAKGAVGKLFSMLLTQPDNSMLASAITEIDAADLSAYDVLLEALSSDNQRLRGLAVFLLGKIGPDAKDALPKLRELLKEARGRGRGAIERAITAIEGKES